MRYFITGGAGFIGSNFVELLFETVENMQSVTIFDKFTYASNPRNYAKFLDDPRLKIVIGDICNPAELEKAMIEHDIVIHFAAESHVDRSIESASEFVRTNVMGTYNVLESSRKLQVKTVIHVSTDEVYGSLTIGAANEKDALEPNSPYAASKAASDLLARSYYITHGLDVRITRCCNNYGKYQFPEKVVPVFIRNLISGKKLPIYGDGTNVREWIHVTDHCRAIQLVLENGNPGEIYNIGSGNHLSNNELATKLILAMGLNVDMKSYVADRKGHDFRYSINSDKLESLGYKQNTIFDLGLIETINWYKKNWLWWDGDELTNSLP